MDIKFASQFIDKVIGDCLKQVAACWNSTFGILGFRISELGRDIPDRPNVRSSLKKILLSFLFVTTLGRHLFLCRLQELSGLLHRPGSGCFYTGEWSPVETPPRQGHCLLFSESQWNSDLERFKKHQVPQRQTAVPQFVPCWCAGTVKPWHSCRYPQHLLFLPYLTWYRSRYNNLSVQHQHWEESVNTVSNSPRKTSTNFITISESIFIKSFGFSSVTIEFLSSLLLIIMSFKSFDVFKTTFFHHIWSTK